MCFFLLVGGQSVCGDGVAHKRCRSCGVKDVVASTGYKK